MNLSKHKNEITKHKKWGLEKIETKIFLLTDDN